MNGGSVRGTPTFSWLASISATAYQFVYDNDVNCPSPSYVLPSCLADDKPPTMAVGGPYYWCVIARDMAAGNLSSWSLSRSVTILPLIPVAPLLVSPVASLLTSDNTPDFPWNSVPYGDTYEIQIDNLSTFATPIEQTAAGFGLGYTASPAFTDGLSTGACGRSTSTMKRASSSARSFTVDTSPPPVPVLSSPANGQPSAARRPSPGWLPPARRPTSLRMMIMPTVCPRYTLCLPVGSDPQAAADGSFRAILLVCKARDLAGNASNWSLSRTITILPVIPVHRCSRPLRRPGHQRQHP